MYTHTLVYAVCCMTRTFKNAQIECLRKPTNYELLTDIPFCRSRESRARFCTVILYCTTSELSKDLVTVQK